MKYHRSIFQRLPVVAQGSQFSCCKLTYNALSQVKPGFQPIGERPPAPGVEAEEFTPMRMEEAVGTNAKEFFEPNLYLFDAYPGGIGFSEPLFPRARVADPEDAGTDSRVPVRGGVPVLRGPGGRPCAACQGSSARDFGSVVRAGRGQIE